MVKNHSVRSELPDRLAQLGKPLKPDHSKQPLLETLLFTTSRLTQQKPTSSPTSTPFSDLPPRLILFDPSLSGKSICRESGVERLRVGGRTSERLFSEGQSLFIRHSSLLFAISVD
ncbi:hypothetical protein NE237_011300 [Protea cynaroides]|uniref:Uncharacterized protein n=1 Tax=Protea cynaroides TaxID=273540 RepID=A0A9Q0GUP5_9MAGN|nr:hypothetical protein NE237_011300 [Protea cynaroides]